MALIRSYLLTPEYINASVRLCQNAETALLAAGTVKDAIPKVVLENSFQGGTASKIVVVYLHGSKGRSHTVPSAETVRRCTIIAYHGKIIVESKPRRPSVAVKGQANSD